MLRSAAVKEFWAFIDSVRQHWKAAVTGSLLIAVPMAVWDRLHPERAISALVYIAVVIVFLLLAIFRAWRDQHRRAVVAEEALKPVLEFYRDPQANPYYEEFKLSEGRVTRYLRVAIRNRGASDVLHARVVIEASKPIGAVGIHLENELHPTGKDPGTLEFAVRAGGHTLVDVLMEAVQPGESWGEFRVAYAQAITQDLLGLVQPDPYEMTLRVEGGPAPVRRTFLLGDRLTWRLDDGNSLPQGG